MQIPFFTKDIPNYKTSQWFFYGLILWQIIGIYLITINVLTINTAWFTFSILAVVMLLMPLRDGLKLFIVSIPFFIVLPNARFESLSMWRPLLLVLFIRAVFLVFVSGAQKFQFKDIGLNIKIRITKLPSWEKFAFLFFLWAVFTLLWARFPVVGLKQLLFIANAALIYPVVVFAIKKREQVWDLLKCAVLSCGIIVFLGYFQFIVTFFTEIYYFWQYWALQVSSLYYGLTLAKVLQYSNSWFTDSAGQKTLRMFSIMPDSHSFALVCVFLIAFTLPILWHKTSSRRIFDMRSLFRFRSGFKQSSPKNLDELVSGNTEIGKWAKYRLWSVIRFAGFAIVLSGTRGVWAGMLVPFFMATAFYFKKIARPVFKNIIFALLLIVILFPATPLINLGLNKIRSLSYEENFLQRAASIFDLNEQSNVGRLIIWQDSLAYVLRHPFGTGFDNFIVSLFDSVPPDKTYAELAAAHNERYNLPQGYITAHSLYLQILVELSLIGLVLFLLIWIFYFRDIWRIIEKFYTETSDVQSLGFVIISLSMAFLWILSHSLFDLTWLNDKILLYTFLALGLARIILRSLERNT